MTSLKNVILILLITFTGSGYAQFSEEYTKYKALYPEDDKVRLNTTTDVTIAVVDGEIEINVDYLEEELYLSATASYFSEESVSYSSFFELLDIKASSFSFQKNKYKEQKVKTFNHKDELSGSVFYDDSKSVNFIYANLKEGAKSKMTYKQKIKDPRFLSANFFGEFFPIINATYTITADKGIELTFKEFNTENLDYQFTKEEKGGNIIYKWVSKNVAKYESEDNTSNFRNTIPHIIPIITSYKVKDEKIELLNDVGGLYKWYYSLVKDVNTNEKDEELIKIVDELLADKTTELEKVKAIYYWVQKNIKYVAFEYALGGFIPREADDVFNKKYGDCKDNSSIMEEMFEIANIKGSLTWIGTRSIPYTYKEIPTPASDNHMILTYLDKNNKPYFLDATGRFYPLGLPTSFIQGKEALIAVDSTQYLIKKVPIASAESNFVTDSITLDIKDLSLAGKGSMKLNGYPKIDYYNALERQKNATDLKDFYNLNFRIGSNKFLINEFKETNKYDYEKDFIVDYSFQIDNYVSSADNEMYINLNLSKDVVDYKIKKEDKLEKEYRFKNYTNYTYVLTVPKGYSVDYIPENVSLESNKYNAHIKYTKKDDKIIYEHDIKLDFLLLKKDEHQGFNKFIEQLDKAYKETIVLKKDNN